MSMMYWSSYFGYLAVTIRALVYDGFIAHVTPDNQAYVNCLTVLALLSISTVCIPGMSDAFVVRRFVFRFLNHRQVPM